MSRDEMTFAVVIGVISALGVIISAILTAYATSKSAERAAQASDRAAQLSRQGLEHQIVINSKAKIAEFRQAWINSLRSEMARVMAMTFDKEHTTAREIIEATAKIQLLMNREDVRYDSLIGSLRSFDKSLRSKDTNFNVEPLVRVCQDILKSEWEVLKKELLELKPAP